MKKVIINILKKYKWTFLITVLFIILNMYLSTYPSKIVGWIIDQLYNIEANKQGILNNIWYLLLAALGLLLTRLPWRTLVTYLARSFEKDLKDKIFEQFLRIKMTSMQNIKNGEIMSYFTQDIAEVRGFYYRMISYTTRIIIIFIIVTYTMIQGTNLKLTIATLCPIIITSFIIVKIKKYVELNFKKAQKNFTELSEYVQESTDSIRTTKAYSGEKYQLKEFIRKNKALKESNIAVEVHSSLISASIKICFGFCYAIALIYGSKLVLNGEITTGDFIAFNGYIGLFFGPVDWIPGLVARYKRAQVSYRRLDNFMKLEREKVLTIEDKKANLISGDIEIRNLSFNYPANIEVALKNIDIKIQEGKTLGIIGTIGSGKTTLANLLLRLYPVQNGKIVIGGRDINDIPVTDLRKSICYITQDSFLFSTTLKENISVFKDGFDDDDIEKSIKKAMIYDEIGKMKEGLDTVIGERGVDLSGGQKQRVAISRAFLLRSNMVIFDDAFSALDNKTEEKVMKNVEKLCKNKTCIIISNRISDIKNADEIIVLEEGQIIQRGIHQELIEQEGMYRKFYNQQSSREEVQTNEE